MVSCLQHLTETEHRTRGAYCNEVNLFNLHYILSMNDYLTGYLRKLIQIVRVVYALVPHLRGRYPHPRKIARG